MQQYALEEPIEFQDTEMPPLFFWLDKNEKRGYFEFNISKMVEDEVGTYPVLFSVNLSENQFLELRDMFERFFVEEV
jgi:hypothetical protein